VWSAHGDRQQRWGGAGVRSGKHRRLGGTATTATGDSRRSTGNAANRSAGASRVLFFVGEAAGVCCRCCLEAAPAPVCWRNSKWWCSAAPQPRHGRQPTRARPKKDGEARRRNFPRPPGRAGTGRRSRRWRRKRPTKLRGRRYVAHGTSHQDPAKRAAGETDGNQGENTGTYSNRTLGGTDFRVEPPEHTSCSLLRSRRCSDPNPAPVGDTDWLWFQVIGQKRDSRQVRRKRLGSNSASSPPQIPVPRGKPCRQESHIWRRCRRLKWSLGHWNCRHTVSAARRPGCCAAHRWTEAITRFLVLWAVSDSYPSRRPNTASIPVQCPDGRVIRSASAEGRAQRA